MFKWVIGIGWSLLCLIVAVIPETALYLIFKFINPTTEMGRILTGGLLLWFGIGVSFLFLVIAFMLWVAGMKALSETY